MSVPADRTTVAPRRVLLVASECAPYAKCGGLGDVVASLPKALRQLEIDARIVMPLYASISKEKHSLQAEPPLRVRCGNGEVNDCGVWRGLAGGEVPIWFVEHDRFFGRAGIYDDNGHEYGDNAFRFGLLGMAAMQMCQSQNWPPDVVHAHDWPTAILMPQVHAWRQAGLPTGRVASVLTIHNQSYQGYVHPSVMSYLGLGAEYFTPDGIEAWGQLNLLKGGINFADAITTVSPTYAREVLSEPGGQGLSTYLQRREAEFSGILNGADYDVWNPETDWRIPANYRADSLIGKAICKRELQAELGLPENPAAPLFGIVTRLAAQKGTGLMRAALPRAIDQMNMQLAVLGSGDADDENFFRWLARTYPDRVSVEVGYSEDLAHRIQAGADFFLMPSLFEPCGLAQMYAMCYGALPVVHATGGLEDTIVQYNQGEGQGTGFKFYTPSDSAFYDTIGWAVSTWYDRPSHVTQMREQAMRVRFDWATSAQRYVEVYRRAVASRRS